MISIITFRLQFFFLFPIQTANFLSLVLQQLCCVICVLSNSNFYTQILIFYLYFSKNPSLKMRVNWTCKNLAWNLTQQWWDNNTVQSTSEVAGLAHTLPISMDAQPPTSTVVWWADLHVDIMNDDTMRVGRASEGNCRLIPFFASGSFWVKSSCFPELWIFCKGCWAVDILCCENMLWSWIM